MKIPLQSSSYNSQNAEHANIRTSPSNLHHELVCENPDINI